MLILTRKTGESIRIGNDIEIRVIEVRGKKARIGIKAPASLPVHREEVFQRLKDENLDAANPVLTMEDLDAIKLDDQQT